MQVYMQRPEIEGRAPSFYHLFLQADLLGGWSFIRESGRQGASGRLKKEHFKQHEAAEEALLKLRDIQLRKGFRVVFIQGDERIDAS